MFNITFYTDEHGKSDVKEFIFELTRRAHTDKDYKKRR